MATLSGNKIKDTYQSLIKLTDNGNLTTGAKQLTDGFGNNSPLYISTTQIGIGVTPEATYDLHVYSNAKVGGNLTVTGDLTVEGTTTTIDTQTLTVEDPLIEVASNNTSTDAVDIGFYGRYAPSGTTLYAGLFRDTGDSKFKLFRNLEEQPTTTVNTSGTGYAKADLVIGNLEATGGNFLGTVYVDTHLEVENSSGFGFLEVGGSSGAYIDLKSPFSDDFDLRLYTAGTNAQINAINGELDITANTNINLQYQGTDVLVMSSTGVAVTGTGSFTGQVTIPETPVADTDAASKGYVDSQVTAQDLDFAGDSGTGAVDLDSQTFTIAGTSNEIETSASGQTLTIGLPNDVTIGNDLTVTTDLDVGGLITVGTNNTILQNDKLIFKSTTGAAIGHNTAGTAIQFFTTNTTALDTLALTISGANATVSGNLSVSGTGSFTGQVTIPATPSASTDAASKGYVDSQVGANNELSEVLANGNTTGGTDISVSSGDDITFADSSKALFGVGNDLEIYHDGTTNDSIIKEAGAGGLKLLTNIIQIRNAADTETILQGSENGSVALYYDNTSKLSTDNLGVNLTDNLFLPSAKYISFNSGAGLDYVIKKNGLDLEFNTGGDFVFLSGQMKLDTYGSGTYTGTATYRLAVDSSGDVIEIPIGGGAVDGSGTANKVTMWSDTDTITDAPITISGNNATFAGIVTANGFRTTSGSTDYSLLTRNSSNTAVYIQQAGAGNILDVRYGSQAAGQGTSAMVVNGTGSVGIGTTSPSTKLHLGGTAPGDSIIRQDSTASGTNWEIGERTAGKWQIFEDDGDTIVATFMSTGNVGINDTNPSGTSGYTYLTINNASNGAAISFKESGSERAAIYYTNSTNLFNIYATETGSQLVFGTNATERMRIDSSGLVRIQKNTASTTEPLLKLSNANGSTTDGVKMIFEVANTSGNGGEISVVRDSGSFNPYMTFNVSSGVASAPTERMRIDSSGAVGIGVTPESNRFASHDVLQVGARATLLANDTVSLTGQTALLDNLYYDSSGNFQHRGNAAGAMVQMYEGNIIFQNSNQTSGTPTVTERMRIDSSGNVGIGTTDPDHKLVLYKNIGYSSDSALYSSYAVNSSAVDNNKVYKWRTGITGNQSGHSLTFSTIGRTESSYTERMRINSSGYVGIRETSPNSYLYVKGTSSVVAGRFWGEAGTVAPLELAQNSGGGFLAKFYSDTFSTVCGSISHSGSATAFNTSSDYRLKENVVEMTGALDRIEQLKPSRFNFIGHEEIVDGFLAHEVSDIVPEAITGTKDEVDAEGNPVYQGIDQSKLVPLLVGAIQELKAEIETLKAQINN